MTPQKFKVIDSDQSYSLSLALSNLQAHTFTLFLASDTVWSLTELLGFCPLFFWSLQTALDMGN